MADYYAEFLCRVADAIGCPIRHVERMMPPPYYRHEEKALRLAFPRPLMKQDIERLEDDEFDITYDDCVDGEFWYILKDNSSESPDG